LGVAEVKLEMDDVKITIRTTLEGNVTETTYVQQMLAKTDATSNGSTSAAPSYSC
jgi:acetyl-CoA carboxylase biotin carboxyl carrier protein